MTKMEMLERFYQRHEELERKFDAAEKAGDTKAMDACQDSHQNLLQEVRVEGEAFGDMMRLYSDMKKHGNSHLDLSGTYQEPEKILKTFREFGVTEFTFSSSWSSAIQVSWAFTQLGCTLEGMIEIYGSGRKFMSNEYAKVPAFLFSL